jgi:alpha-L-fucosidase 2
LLTPARTAPNLFDLHPPFQIDGNFGGVSGVTEMLLQSHAGEVSLLPALPDAWPSGAIRGLRARDGFTVDFTWRTAAVTSVRVVSEQGARLRLRTSVPLRVEGLREVSRPEAGVVEFDTRPGGVYVLRP